MTLLLYDQPAYESGLNHASNLGVFPFKALALNWRGLLVARSAVAIRALGLSASLLSLIPSVNLERGMTVLSYPMSPVGTVVGLVKAPY